MRSRLPLTLLMTLLITLLVASAADARLTTKLMVGKDGGLGGLGLGSGQLIEPGDAAVAPNGDIYVVEGKDCTVRVFSASGTPLRQFGSCPSSNYSSSGNQLLTSPTAISVDAKSRVYVSSYNGLVVTDSVGNVLGRLGNAVSDPYPMGPVGTAVIDPDPSNPNGATELFVADGTYSRVYRLDVSYADNSINFGWIAGVDVVSGNAETGFEVCTDFSMCKGGAGGADWSSTRDVSIAGTSGPVFVLNSNRFVKKLDPQSGQEIGSGIQLATYPTYSTIAARSDGGLYASPLGGDTGYIASFDSDGNQLTSLGTQGSPSAATGGFGTPYAVSSVPGGAAFTVADASMHRAGVYASSSGANIRLVGKHDGIGWQHGSGSNGFAGVSDVVSDGAGGYWILDRGNRRVVRYSADGTQIYSTIDLTTIGLQGRISPYGPQGMGISANGSQLYVADSWNNRVIRFDINVAGHTWTFNSMVGNDVDSSNGSSAVGEVCTTAAVCQGGLVGTDSRSFSFPVDVAVVPDSTFPVNNVWVVEQNNNRVVRFDQNFNWGASIGKNSGAGGSGSASTNDGEFSSPQAIAFESDGSFWVPDGSGRLQKFDTSATFAKKFYPAYMNGQTKYAVGQLGGLAVSGSTLYVAEPGIHRVAAYATSTTIVVGGNLPDSTFGAIGSNAGQLYQPRGISVSGGDFLVADDGNSRMQVIGEDANAPSPGSITAISPSTGSSLLNKTSVELDFDAHDSDGEALTCSPAAGSQVALPNVGANQINIACDDPLSDNDVTATVSYTRVDDHNAPTVVIDTPVDGSTQTTNSVVLDYGASDDQDPNALDCDRDPGDAITLSPGANVITVNCTDWAGNVGTATATVTYTPPAPPATPSVPAGPAAPAAVPNATIKFAKKQKFKGVVSATVTCDMACPLVFTVSAKVGKKEYTAVARATLTAAGAKVLKAKFKKSATKAILALTKLPKFTYSLSYGAKAGKSGAVKMSR